MCMLRTNQFDTQEPDPDEIAKRTLKCIGLELVLSGKQMFTIHAKFNEESLVKKKHSTYSSFTDFVIDSSDEIN